MSVLGWGASRERQWLSVKGSGSGRPLGSRSRRVWRCRGDFASFLSWPQPAPSPGPRARLGGRGGTQACKHPGEGTGVLAGRPRLRTVAETAETGLQDQRGAGRGVTRTHPDSGRRRLLRGTPVRPRPAPPRPAPPRSAPPRPARAAVPPTASLARQRLHSMVLCSAPAALATTEFHSTASGRVWFGSSRRIDSRTRAARGLLRPCGPPVCSKSLSGSRRPQPSRT